MSVSGERGTKSQQQDRRNAADRERAAGGSRSSGERGTMGQQQDRRNMETARRAGNAAPGVGANRDRGTLSQQQDRINQNRALARSNTAPGVGNYSDAMDDYNNVGQGFFDDPLGAIGRFFGGGFGIGEIDPRTQAPSSFQNRNTASWGVDPIGAALGIGGSFLGPFGTLASGLYNRSKSLFDYQGPMIAFDGNQPVTGPFSGFDNPFGDYGGGTLAPGQAGQMAGPVGNSGGYGGTLAPQQAATSSIPQQASAPQPAAQGPSYGPYPGSYAPQPMQWSQPGMSGLTSWGVQPQMAQQPMQQPLWSPTGQQHGFSQRPGHSTGWR